MTIYDYKMLKSRIDFLKICEEGMTTGHATNNEEEFATNRDLLQKGLKSLQEALLLQVPAGDRKHA